jgi:hypothetical protein
MSRKPFLGVWFVLVLALASNTLAVDTHWTDANPCDSLWSTAGNWHTNMLPTSADTVYMNNGVGPTINSCTTGCADRIYGPGNGTLNIGTLGGGDNTTITTGKLLISMKEVSDYGHVYLYSGLLDTVDVTGYHTGNDILIDIYEGTLIVRNKTGGSIQDWIDNSCIVAYGGTGTVILEKTPENWDKLTAILDPNIAKNPSPADGTSVAGDVVLSWLPGDYAVSHDVYLGTDFNDVNNASRLNGDINGNGWVDLADVLVLTEQWLQKPADSGPSADLNDDGGIDLVDFIIVADNWMDSGDGIFRGHHTLDANSYAPYGFEPNETYYWRIDEVNDAHSDSPWKGKVWTFTVISYPKEGIFNDNFEDLSIGRWIYCGVYD